MHGIQGFYKPLDFLFKKHEIENDQKKLKKTHLIEIVISLNLNKLTSA